MQCDGVYSEYRAAVYYSESDDEMLSSSARDNNSDDDIQSPSAGSISSPLHRFTASREGSTPLYDTIAPRGLPGVMHACFDFWFRRYIHRESKNRALSSCL